MRYFLSRELEQIANKGGSPAKKANLFYSFSSSLRVFGLNSCFHLPERLCPAQRGVKLLSSMNSLGAVLSIIYANMKSHKSSSDPIRQAKSSSMNENIDLGNRPLRLKLIRICIEVREISELVSRFDRNAEAYRSPDLFGILLLTSICA